MPVTYLDLRNSVSRRVIDAPPAVVAELPGLVLDAMEEAQNRFNFPVMREEASFTSAAGTHTLGAVPSDFKEFRERPYWIENTQGRVHKFPPVRAKQPALDGAQDQQIGPPRYLVQDEQDPVTNVSNFLLYPLSDGASDYSDGQYRIRIPYYKYLPTLSADGDTNALLLNRRIVRFVVDWATKLCFELNWDAGKAASWETIAEKSWLKIKGREGGIALLGLDVLVPHQGANDPRAAE